MCNNDTTIRDHRKIEHVFTIFFLHASKSKSTPTKKNTYILLHHMLLQIIVSFLIDPREFYLLHSSIPLDSTHV